MNETDFIELALRYIDGGTDRAEVDRLGSAMLDDQRLRLLFRDLVRQSQLSHEWLLTAPPAPATTRAAGRRIVVVAAAAAALVVAGFLILLRPPGQVPAEAADTTEGDAAGADFFGETAPTWAEIYKSPFDYPDFVWEAEIAASSPEIAPIDEFSDFGIPNLGTSSSGEFVRLLAPIALLPIGPGSMGNSLYY